MSPVNRLPHRVRIVEVGPRDGLQNEAMPIPTETKLAFIRGLADAGLKDIEATSFVHPRAIPQLADADDVAAQLPRDDGVTYSMLAPNDRGLDRAIAAGAQRIAVFTAASETFAKKNINMTIAESLATFAPVIARASEHDMTVRGYLSTCFVCPYEGEIDRAAVARVTEALFGIGVDEVAISDTIGAAGPNDVKAVLDGVLAVTPRESIALHLHDTYGTALVNVYAGLQMGVTTFDASAGGLGGCPYAPGASGNLATEDLVYLLDRLGIQHGVDLAGVVAAAEIIGRALGRTVLPSRQSQRLRAECATP